VNAGDRIGVFHVRQRHVDGDDTPEEVPTSDGTSPPESTPYLRPPVRTRGARYRRPESVCPRGPSGPPVRPERLRVLTSVISRGTNASTPSGHRWCGATDTTSAASYTLQIPAGVWPRTLRTLQLGTGPDWRPLIGRNSAIHHRTITLGAPYSQTRPDSVTT
jgi:hypothetical protein